MGIAFVVVMIIGDGGNPAIFGVIGHGGAERLIVYPVMLWMLALGGYLMAAPEPLLAPRAGE
jgi:anti-sigma-K factor RskA